MPGTLVRQRRAGLNTSCMRNATFSQDVRCSSFTYDYFIWIKPNNTTRNGIFTGEASMVTLRALAPSLTRITVAGAVGAALHIGQGNCDLIDDQAVEFSRAVLHQTDVEGEVICCEGPKDNAPSFAYREKVGTGRGPKVEFVIDPVDGTTAASKGRKDAISALACAPAGCFQVLPDDGYYFKIATSNHSLNKISPDMSVEEIVQTVAKAKSLPLANFTVIMLERETTQRYSCPIAKTWSAHYTNS